MAATGTVVCDGSMTERRSTYGVEEGFQVDELSLTHALWVVHVERVGQRLLSGVHLVRVRLELGGCVGVHAIAHREGGDVLLLHSDGNLLRLWLRLRLMLSLQLQMLLLLLLLLEELGVLLLLELVDGLWRHADGIRRVRSTVRS